MADVEHRVTQFPDTMSTVELEAELDRLTNEHRWMLVSLAPALGNPRLMTAVLRREA